MSAPLRVWLLTGPPAIGKSTVVSKVIYALRARGHAVGGCLTKERKEGGFRVGFTIIDLMSGREGTLASIEGILGPRVGKYRVDLSGVKNIGARALADASKAADVIVIDEVGPMELTSPDFRRGVESCLESAKPMLAVVHEQMKDPLIERLRDLPGRELIEITLQNRDHLAETLAQEIMQAISSS